MTAKINSRIIHYYLTLIGLVSHIFFNYKATPTNDTDYSFHTKVAELGSIPSHIPLLVITSLRADTCIYTCYRQNQFLETRHASVCGQHMPSLKVIQLPIYLLVKTFCVFNFLSYYQ